jgi:hypothetical protein
VTILSIHEPLIQNDGRIDLPAGDITASAADEGASKPKARVRGESAAKRSSGNPQLKSQPNSRRMRRSRNCDDAPGPEKLDWLQIGCHFDWMRLQQSTQDLMQQRLIPLGFEPRLIDPESIVLPLHHGIAGANLADFREGCKPRKTVCLSSAAANLSHTTSLREAVRRAGESAARRRGRGGSGGASPPGSVRRTCGDIRESRNTDRSRSRLCPGPRA